MHDIFIFLLFTIISVVAVIFVVDNIKEAVTLFKYSARIVGTPRVDSGKLTLGEGSYSFGDQREDSLVICNNFFQYFKWHTS